MPSRHSKNAGIKHHFTYGEKQKAGLGSKRQRLGTESQLPFGYCSLSMQPAVQPVVSPSGRLYSREAILEYILAKTQDLKRQGRLYEEQQAEEERDAAQRSQREEAQALQSFSETQDVVVPRHRNPNSNSSSSSSSNHNNISSDRSFSSATTTIAAIENGGNSSAKVSALVAYDPSASSSSNSGRERNADDSGVAGSGSSSQMTVFSSEKGSDLGIGARQDATHAVGGLSQQRHKLIDERSKEQKLEEMKRTCPWVPHFTPSAPETRLQEPPKRPASPFSGQPLRVKDLIPVSLIPEERTGPQSGPTRFLCPVTRKTITTQKVVLLKNSGTLMLESAAQELAYPSLTCPLTGRPFKKERDVLHLVNAGSGFAATGQVIAKLYRPSIN